MEDEILELVCKVQELCDLELACLLCFVADQHCCIIETDEHDLSGLQKDLKSICSNTFSVQSSIVHCSSSTTCEEFSRAILVDDDSSHSDRLETTNAVSSKSDKGTPEGRIPNVIIVTGLNESSELVQVQALELIRGHRIFSRTEIHVAPKNMLLISLQQHGSKRHHPLLNDHMFICHSHITPMGKGYPFDDIESDAGSMTSVIHSPPPTPGEMVRRSSKGGQFITPKDIDDLTALTSSVSMSPDIRAHVHDIVIYLRNHRAIAGGATAIATRHLNLLSRVLAPLHNLTFITPSLVALAVRKIYPHRLVLMQPEQERSMQWGSTLDAVTELLRDIRVEEVIEEVLGNVETPL